MREGLFPRPFRAPCLQYLLPFRMHRGPELSELSLHASAFRPGQEDCTHATCLVVPSALVCLIKHLSWRNKWTVTTVVPYGTTGSPTRQGLGNSPGAMGSRGSRSMVC